MQPKREPEQPRRELFQIDLEQLIDMSHALVRLGDVIDWHSLEQSLGSTYHPSHGAPGISTRLMVALHYLKYQHDLSDEDVVALWVENPYWQHFSGMKHFQHQMPIDPSSMTRWRVRRQLVFPVALTRHFCYRARGCCLIENATQGEGTWEGENEETDQADYAPGPDGRNQPALS